MVCNRQVLKRHYRSAVDKRMCVGRSPAPTNATIPVALVELYECESKTNILQMVYPAKHRVRNNSEITMRYAAFSIYAENTCVKTIVQ